MALNFGIKYNDGSTFQPDFLVMFKNGNERVTAIPSQKPRVWYKNYAISSILV